MTKAIVLILDGETSNKRYHEYRDILVKVLRLPGHKALFDDEWIAIIIDVTE